MEDLNGINTDAGANAGPGTNESASNADAATNADAAAGAADNNCTAGSLPAPVGAADPSREGPSSASDSSGAKESSAGDNSQGAITLAKPQTDAAEPVAPTSDAARDTQDDESATADNSPRTENAGATHGSAIQQQTRGTQVPRWQQISGLTPEAEPKMSRSERRHAIRKLFKEYEKLVREFLLEHENDPEKDERSFLWDPLAAICIELGIARRKLSALTKELTGMAAHDVIDKIRAEKLKGKLRKNLAGVCRGGYTPGEYNTFRTAMHLYVQKQRREECYDPAHFATWLGFANYARMRRGCMLAHKGLTPRQVEFDILHEFDWYYNIAESLSARRSALTDYKSRYYRFQNAGNPYHDAWARAKRDYPELIEQMRSLLGLSENCVECATWENHPPLTEEEQRDKERREKSNREYEERERQKKEEFNRKMGKLGVKPEDFVREKNGETPGGAENHGEPDASDVG